MKNSRIFRISAVILLMTLLISFLSCKKKCTAPTVTFSNENITLSQGDTVNVTVTITSTKDITDVSISKTISGIADANFKPNTGAGTTNRIFKIFDVIPASAQLDAKIVYSITATNSCGNKITKELSATIVPSKKVLDPYYFLYENSTSPKMYSRYSTAGPTASHLVLSPNICDRTKSSPSTEKDICDSLYSPTGNPFIPNARWGSANGSKFVKAPGFNWATASQSTIVAAYKSGVPTDLINIAAGDFVIINIRNSGDYAVVKIRSVVDDGAASNDDYILYSYKMTHK